MLQSMPSRLAIEPPGRFTGCASIADDDGGNRHKRLYKRTHLLVGCKYQMFLPEAKGGMENTIDI